MNEQSDDWILSNIKSSNSLDRNKALKLVYHRYYGHMTEFVLRNSGSEVEAADLFQDALVVF
ncbi:MAG: hypothetical protein AAF990_20550 [Bacteroidota bacterium]